MATITRSRRAARVEASGPEAALAIQLERIAVGAGHAPHHQVDPLQAVQRLEEDLVVAHRQVGALDQRVAEIAGDVGMAEIGRIRGSLDEQHRPAVVAIERAEQIVAL